MIPLEHLADGSISDRNFQKLMHLVVDTAGLEVAVRFGIGSLTWPGGSRLTGALTIDSGLGVTPTVVVFGSVETNMHVALTGVPSTASFTVQGNTIDGSSPPSSTSRSFYWVAVG